MKISSNPFSPLKEWTKICFATECAGMFKNIHLPFENVSVYDTSKLGTSRRFAQEANAHE